jgi:uncharacterized damage-inducible protein DinB
MLHESRINRWAGSLNGTHKVLNLSNMNKAPIPEPWLRGTLTDVDPVQRAVLHALDLAKEDLERWCVKLSDEELNARPRDLAPAAFHIRHIARSIDRLLTYAEGTALSSEQIALMKSELDPGATGEQLFSELNRALKTGVDRIRSFSPGNLRDRRTVGRQQMPTTVAGLLVHVADHTQRHVGQAITTAKIVKRAAASRE